MTKIFWAALTLGIAVSAVPASANLVTNPGFETGDFTGWTQGGNIDGFSDVSGADPHSGSFAADLGAQVTDFTLDQTIAVAPSTTYEVSFWYSNGFDADPADGVTNHFSASFDGMSLLNLTNVSAFDYTELDVMVTTGAADTTALLDFAAHNDADFFHLDDVSVSAVAATPTAPEPASILLFASGLAVLAVRRRRVAR